MNYKAFGLKTGIHPLLIDVLKLMLYAIIATYLYDHFKILCIEISLAISFSPHNYHNHQVTVN